MRMRSLQPLLLARRMMSYHATRVPVIESLSPAPFPGLSGQLEVVEERHKYLLNALRSSSRPAIAVVTYTPDYQASTETSFRGCDIGCVVRPTMLVTNRPNEDEKPHPLMDFVGDFRFSAHNLQRDEYGNWWADLERLIDVPSTPLELRKADMLAQVLERLFESYIDMRCDRDEDHRAFQERMGYVREQGLAPFSYWAAKQIYPLIQHDDNQHWLQYILETRDLTARLEELSNRFQPIVEIEAEVMKTQRRLSGLELVALQGGQEVASSKM
eukprot:TRINITY_DN6875_c0_g1_i2.p1 TRINITY_DN6875_c0_g1~~TRINITY_DN6875_c0_g1_i2.p1  ORF type:complete len:271 (+),score=33.32 TRINITY_DN6875_c0_g1_i2:412-1224(+)